MLLANNLSFERNGNMLFSNLDISVSSNKIVHISGRNGIGKTTLIKILTNLLIPKTGEIFWNGKNIKKDIKEFFKNLTYLMDNQTSKEELTIEENAKFWIKLFSSKIKLRELESILNLLSLNKKSKVCFLSKGEIRKLELCRLILEQKKLWIIDEPYSGLDNNSIELINETFKNHARSGGMIIFSSHYKPELANMDTIEFENYEIH